MTRVRSPLAKAADAIGFASTVADDPAGARSELDDDVGAELARRQERKRVFNIGGANRIVA